MKLIGNSAKKLRQRFIKKCQTYSLFAKPDKKSKKEFYSVKHLEQKLCTNEWRLHNQICACKGGQKQHALDFKACQENIDGRNSIVLLKLPTAAEAANFVENLRVSYYFLIIFLL